MKKIFTFILLMCMVLTLSACGKVEVTMQEIYDAVQTEAMLKNHENVYIRDELDGKIWMERYLTKEYICEHFIDEELAYAELMTDAARYVYSSGDYLRYLYIAPDGVTNDFASDRAETYVSVILGEETLDETIESVSKKDGRMTVTSVLSSKNLETFAEVGVTAGKFGYVLDAKSREIISLTGDYTYDNGETHHMASEVIYDAEAPEMVKTFLEYDSQTENLRNVTVITNPGTEKEVSQNFQIPKGLVIGFTWSDDFEDKVGLYSDAACTESYDAYANTDSDLTIYVKWTE